MLKDLLYFHFSRNHLREEVRCCRSKNEPTQIFQKKKKVVLLWFSLWCRFLLFIWWNDFHNRYFKVSEHSFLFCKLVQLLFHNFILIYLIGSILHVTSGSNIMSIKTCVLETKNILLFWKPKIWCLTGFIWYKRSWKLTER